MLPFRKRFNIFRVGFAACLLLLGAGVGYSDEQEYLPWGIQTSDDVQSLAVQHGGLLLIGGVFSYLYNDYEDDGIERHALARLRADGSADPTFPTDFPANEYIEAIAVCEDGRTYAGGTFGIRRIMPSGNTDPDFAVPMNGSVHALAMEPNGNLIVVGNFSEIGGVETNNVARILANGTVDFEFTVSMDWEYRWVSAVAVQDDGRIVIGGYFYAVEGQPRSLVARLESNGDLDPSFDPPTIDNGIHVADVRALLADSDGNVVIGGHFATVGGQPRPSIARLESAGTLDPGFAPNPGPDIIRSLLLQCDGSVIIGGTNLFGNASGLAKWNANPLLGSDYSTIGRELSALATMRDGRVAVAGAGLHGQQRNVVLMDNIAAVEQFAISSTEILWTRGGGAAESVAAKFALSTDGGSSWVELGNAERVPGGWKLDGLVLPPQGKVRGRVVAPSGSGVSILEHVVTFPDAQVTQTPELHTPYSHVIQRIGSNIIYFLPETAAPDSVQIHYVPASGGVPAIVLNIAPAGESAGTHTFALHPNSPGTATLVESAPPIPDGVYNVHIRYADIAGNPVATSNMASMVSVATSKLSLWKTTVAGNLAASDDSDDDGDGHPLLLEYALVLDPAAYDAGPEFSVYTDDDAGKSWLQARFLKDADRNDITISVEAAGSLSGSWSLLAESINGGALSGPADSNESSEGNGKSTVTVYDTIEIGDPSHSSRFLKIRVHQQIDVP